jgi:hypothetical protein
MIGVALISGAAAPYEYLPFFYSRVFEHKAGGSVKTTSRPTLHK